MTEDSNARFWAADDEVDFAQAVTRAVQEADAATEDRQRDILANMAQYGCSSYQLSSTSIEFLPEDKRRLSENTIAGAVDTIIAQVAQTKPRTMFMTVSGSWTDQTKAKRLMRYSDAKGQDVRAQKLLELGFRDGLVAGTGFIHTYVDYYRRRTTAERVFPLNIIVDDLSCVDVDPRCLYRRHYIDRWLLMRRFPKFADQLEGAPRPKPIVSASFDERADVVCVVEPWHLPSDCEFDYEDEEEWEKKTDGCTAGVVEGTDIVLWRRPYLHHDYPFVVIRPLDQQRGWCGSPVIDRGVPMQRELNRLLRRNQEAMNLVSVPRWWMRSGDFAGAQMQNGIGQLLFTKSGQPPQAFTPPAMPPDVYKRIDELPSRVLAVMGSSEPFAQGQIPAGLRSGKSQLVYRDVSTQRHVLASREYEHAKVQMDKLFVRAERELSKWLRDEHEIDHTVLYKDRGSFVRLNWDDLDLEDDNLLIQAFPASALPIEPHARLEFLEGMLQSGTIDHQMFWHLVDMPDFESARDFVVAPLELLKATFDRILEDGKRAYRPPLPNSDLALGIRLCVLATQRAELMEAPPDRIKLLHKWYVDAIYKRKGAEHQEYLKAITPVQPAPPPGANGLAPMAPPGGGALPPMPIPPAGGMPPDGGMPPPMIS